jgi:DNA polymerase III alpha subunit
MTTQRESDGHSKTMPFLGIGSGDSREPQDISNLEAPDRLKKLCTMGRDEQGDSVQKRLDHELDIIHALGLDDYFLALADIYRFASSQGHMLFLDGPTASSLVVHQLGLNPVNPLQHELLFERFLHADQTYAPSVNLCISDGDQEEVVRYARSKFGWEEMDEDRPWNAYRKPWQPLAGGKTGRAIIDVTVHSGLTVQKDVVAIIRERRGFHAIPGTVPVNDAKTLDLFRRGDTEGIYLFNWDVAQELLLKMQPRSVDDLVIVVALFHKAIIDNGIASEYLDRRTGKATSPNQHPLLNDILEETHGVLLFWEQIIEIVYRIGNLDRRDGMKLLKALWTQKEKVIGEFRDKFLTAAAENQIGSDDAKDIFDKITSRGGFTQCKAKAVSDATIAYQLGYLKAHFPDEFAVAEPERIYVADEEALDAYLKANNLYATVPPDVRT